MESLILVRDAAVDWLANGALAATWWQVLLATLVMTHITISGVTIFLHRAQAHRALDLHALPAHFFRLWLWLTTGMVTKEFVAIHRKHHAKCETEEDPHSPQTRGIKALLLTGVELYRAESKVPATMTKYGLGTPDDWIERNLYTRFSWQGVGVMLIIDLLLFGAIGITVWAVQMLWIPVMATGIINGIGHWWGYRNFESPDASRNVSPWGIVIGGEELHNNHHTYPTSAKFSVKPYEFDIGWLYIRGLESLGLAKVRKTPPKLELGAVRVADGQTLEALIDQLALRDRVDLIGQRDDVPELIAVADAVVLPSVREGLSNVILEGMMGGKPVVASRAGGNVELVEHERSGLLFDVGDDAGLAQAFIRLANDAGLRKRLGDGARERALNHFSIPSMVRAYERTYSDVVRERATTP